MSIEHHNSFNSIDTHSDDENPKLLTTNHQHLLKPNPSTKPFFALTENLVYDKDKAFTVINVKIQQTANISKLPSIATNNYLKSENQRKTKKLFDKDNPNHVYNKRLDRLISTKKVKNNFEKSDILDNSCMFVKSPSYIQAFIANEQLGLVVNKLRRSMRLINHKKDLIERFKEKINKIKEIESNMKKINKKINYSHMSEFESLKDILELYGATRLIKRHFSNNNPENDINYDNIKRLRMDNLFLLLKVLITVLLLVNELCRLLLYFYSDLPDIDKDKYEFINKEIKLELRFFNNYFHLFEFASFKLNQNFEILFEIYEIFKFQTQIQKTKVKKITDIHNARYFFLIVQNARINFEELHFRIFNFDDLIKI